MLTDEDKNWIGGQITASEHRVVTRLEKTETALLEYIEARVEKTETALLEHIEARIEKTETTLLTEFHKWASPVEMRQRTRAAALRAVDAEMEALSDRVKKLEAS